MLGVGFSVSASQCDERLFPPIPVLWAGLGSASKLNCHRTPYLDDNLIPVLWAGLGASLTNVSGRSVTFAVTFFGLLQFDNVKT